MPDSDKPEIVPADNEVVCPDCGGRYRAYVANQPCPHCLLQTVIHDSRAGMETWPASEFSCADSGCSENSASQEREDGERYIVGEMIARGGMGKVMDARQLPVGRSVALKVIHDEISGEPVIRQRFIEEAQITGQLEHPSIVPMHDLCIDEKGNAFYVMKKVEGETLAAILRRIRKGDDRTIEEYSLIRLLTVFQKICDAIAFAHSRGVIHRDLKPENVMVGAYGEVLVMDWGLAKVMGIPELESEREDFARPEGVPELTMEGSAMGTIGYMPPEQAAGNIEAIGYCSDIYALGAILYEILTLRRTIEGGTIDEALERICSGDIEPPSTSGAGKRDKEVSVQEIVPRHCPSGRIPPSLAAVAMKALSREPEDRYATVSDLQREIEAFQTGFATEAENAGFLRHLGLFVRRHKVESVAALVVLALLVSGIVVSDVLRRRAVQAEEIALAAKNEAEGVANFLGDILFDPVPGRETIESISYSELTDHAIEELASRKDLSRASRLELEYQLSGALYRSGRPEVALALAERVHAEAEKEFGEEDEFTTETLRRLASLLLENNRVDRSVDLYREVEKRKKKRYGPLDVRSLQAKGDLAVALSALRKLDEALQLQEEVVEAIYKLPVGAGVKYSEKWNLRSILFKFQDREHLARALVVMDEVIEEKKREGNEDPGYLLAAQKSRIEILVAMGRSRDPEMEEDIEELLQMTRNRYEGIDHDNLVAMLNTVAGIHFSNGNREKAEAVAEEAFEMSRRLGFRNRAAIPSIETLSNLYARQGRHKDRISILEEFFEMAKSWPEKDRSLVASPLVPHLAFEYNRTERMKEAVELYKEYIGMVDRVLEPQHPYARELYRNYIKFLTDNGQIEDAREVAEEVENRFGDSPFYRFQQAKIAAKRKDLEEAIRLSSLAFEQVMKESSGRFIQSNAPMWGQISSWYYAAGKWEEKLQYEEKLLKSGHGEDKRIRFNLLMHYTTTLVKLERESEIEPYLSDWWNLWNENYPGDRQPAEYRIYDLTNLAAKWKLLGNFERAVEAGEEAVRRYRIKLGETHVNTLRVSNNLYWFYRENEQKDKAKEFAVGMVEMLEEKKPDDTSLSEWMKRAGTR